MKKVAALLGMILLAGLVWVGCLDQAGPGTSTYKGPLFRYHYAGRTHLPTGTNAVVYREIDALPLTAELRGELAQKLAAGAFTFWKRDLPAGVPDASTNLAPLLEDLQVAEAYVEVRGSPGRTETVVAAELSDARAQVWQARLRELAAAWKLGSPRDVTLEGAKGWEAKRTQAPNTLQFFRTGAWVLVGLGQDAIPQLTALLKEARGSGRPLPALPGSFREVSVDFPALRSWFPALAKFPLPAAVVSWTSRADNVRTDARLHYASPIRWRSEPWKIPTNAISDPVTSFTVGQGIAPLLSVLKGSADLGVNPLPNQFCAWGIKHAQCRIFFSVPVPGDSTNVIKQVAVQLPKFILANVTNARGDFFFVSNRAEVVWADLPFMVPVLHAERNGKDNFLVGGNFPLSANQTPVPPELYAQVRGRTNLLYYDWEITQERLTHAKQFYQLACMATGRRSPNVNTVPQRWLAAITPKLGNTVTEITKAGPQEIALVRKSHLGLTGFEIATFCAWVDSPGFPFEFELPGILPWTVTDSAVYRMAHPEASKRPLKGDPAPGPRPAAPAGTNALPAGKRGGVSPK